MQYKDGKGPTRYQFLRGLVRAYKKADLAGVSGPEKQELPVAERTDVRHDDTELLSGRMEDTV